jgi:O-antigen/teichoic acid export membrane protein
VAGTNPAILLILSTIAGLRDIAALRAAQLVVSPLSLALAALLLIALPELARIYSETPDRLPRVLDVSGALFAVASLVFGAVASAVPATVGRALVGPNWHAAQPLVLPFALQFAALGFTTSWLMGLRILEAARAALLVQLAFAPAYVGGAVVGMMAAGPLGAAYGLAGASILTMLPMRTVAMRRFIDARRKRAAYLSD